MGLRRIEVLRVYLRVTKQWKGSWVCAKLVLGCHLKHQHRQQEVAMDASPLLKQCHASIQEQHSVSTGLQAVSPA